MSREIARHLPYYKGELELGHPKFPESRKAAPFDGHDAVSGGQMKNLEHSEENDHAIKDWI